MALQQFVFGVAVAILFTSEGSHSSPVCGTGGSPGNWPWQASITRNGTYVCGGTLVTDRWVLTAAQCIMTWGSPIIPVVYVGSTISSGYLNSGVSHDLDATICFSPENYLEDDICMIRLSSPVNFTSNVQPVCLAAKGSTFYTGVSSWVAGWGSETNGNNIEYTYYDMNTTLVGENECSCRRGATVGNTSLCAGTDSYSSLQSVGIPLMVQKDSVWIQTGILTTSCRGTEPCVYTDVSKYQDWIKAFGSSNNLPGFVSFTSAGQNSDLDYSCTTTPGPMTSTTDDPSVFAGGDKMTPHFRQLLSLFGLTLLLFVLG